MLHLTHGYTIVNKFGRSTNVDSGVATDLWDGANSTDDIDIWVPPTQARVHDIKSTSANDDATGTGVRTIRIYGLTSWGSDEVSELISMDGATNVSSTNSYVIIHRMKTMTAGSGGTNAGKITATAQTDATVTAQINVGQGQTQMAIYGVPSTQNAYMCAYYVSAMKASGSHMIDCNIMANPEPNNNLDTWVVKHSIGLMTTGTNFIRQPFDPQKTFEGPTIIKLQASGSSNDLDVSGGFDLVLMKK